LISLHEELNFHNVDQWLKQVDQISHDSEKNRWTNQDLNILSECEDQSMTNVNLNYQNSKNDIRFLLDHESFEFHFSYSFVRQYNDDDERIFNEMHIDD
jgi:membrane-associated HD superfamily phosphohydrolase